MGGSWHCFPGPFLLSVGSENIPDYILIPNCLLQSLSPCSQTLTVHKSVYLYKYVMTWNLELMLLAGRLVKECLTVRCWELLWHTLLSPFLNVSELVNWASGQIRTDALTQVVDFGMSLSRNHWWNDQDSKSLKLHRCQTEDKKGSGQCWTNVTRCLKYCSWMTEKVRAPHWTKADNL